ncbi:hypothetical protein QJS10_CPA08g00356 [Acorus calamus]|uniref:Uncharacterized protein n=1 Tax=Acorus calamus TaxID=4465 RepID=A0AAV9E976_ACOCL|nr:hypothetical protein QJS10_CPA08g00356 [Acorus calamus]
MASLILLFSNPPSSVSQIPSREPPRHSIPKSDVDILEFPLNLEYLEAEFFLWASLGYGLDKVSPNLTMGGPPPIGLKKANLDPLTRDIDHAPIRISRSRPSQNTVRGFPRPLIDLSAKNFAEIMDKAFCKPLRPPFDPYANSLNFVLASYLIPYVGLTGYVGSNSTSLALTQKGYD